MQKSSCPDHPLRQVEHHLNVRLLPFLTALFGILYILTSYRGWLVFTLGAGGAWLVGRIWIHSLERNLCLERKIHLAWATAGESVPEQVRLVNHGWFPAIWVEISDDSSTLERPLRLVSDVGQHSARNRHVNHLYKRRGLYTLGPTRIRTGDPLGIYTTTLHDQHASTVLVTPPLLSLTQLKILPGGWAGDERQRRGAVARNISTAGLRNYVPGDSLRRIHWRASAHFDTLIVRQLEAASSWDWWIIVDLDRTVQAGAGDDSTLELGVILAASMAMRGLRERRRVGLIMASPQFVRIEPGADPAQRWRILRALAMAEAGGRPLADLLASLQPQQPATSIVVTPSTNTAWVAAVNRERAISGMMALLIDPNEFDAAQDQGKVTRALAQRRISYTRMPATLLKEAYSAVELRKSLSLGALEPRKIYLQRGRENWQAMR
jgi:uncharacterized protein (DUF58 family)